MQTDPVTTDDIANSVIAVPPLARDVNCRFHPGENEKIIRHIEGGGVTTLLYGGNANFYHMRPSEYHEVLEGLRTIAGRDTLVIPSVGPAYGLMMEQAETLKDFDFPTVMILPQQGITSYDGVETGIRHFAEAYGKPVVIYIKNDGYLEVDNARRLVDDGLISWIKYAVVREDPADDAYLRELVDSVNPEIIVSGIGEQPAIVHLRDFGVGGFTSGCVCVRPDMSASMLKACKEGKWEEAEVIRKKFCGLEDLRNEINPIRVLHDAVSLAGIAESGPLTPLLSNLSDTDQDRVKAAAVSLLNT